jgi:putative ABC transport system permease protein
MFLRFVSQSIRRSPRRKAMTVAAVAMGSAVATAMLGVMLDIGDRVNRELRSLGANLIVTPKGRALPVEIGGVSYRPVARDEFIPEAAVPKIKTTFWHLNIIGVAPVLRAETRIGDRTVPVEGRRIEVPEPARNCILGSALARRLHMQKGSAVTLFGEPFTVARISETGGDEEDRAIVRLDVLQRLTHREGQVDAVEVSALTKPEDAFATRDPAKMSPAEYDRWYCTPYVSSIAHQIEEALPMAVARPVRRVADNEGKVLNKIRGLMLLISIAALASAALTVWSVMATTVLERRAEIAIMQATGAANRVVAALFAAEVAIEGAAGGLIGALAGAQLAAWVGEAVFQSRTQSPALLVPLTVLVAVAVAIAGAAQPLRRSLALEPAVTLREGT